MSENSTLVFIIIPIHFFVKRLSYIRALFEDLTVSSHQLIDTEFQYFCQLKLPSRNMNVANACNCVGFVRPALDYSITSLITHSWY